MGGWMTFPVPSRTAGADHILYTRGNKHHQLHGPEKRLPSYTSKSLRRGLGQDTGGRRGLDLDVVWVSACGMNTAPRPGGMRVYDAVRLGRICSLLDPAAPLRRDWPMRCYTIRGPLIRTRTVGYGRGP